MIGYLLSFIILAAVVCSVFGGTAQQVSAAVISSGADAVSLTLTLAGAMAVWGGVMRIAEKSGLTKNLTKVLKPILRFVFRGLDRDSRALGAIAMNVSANLLGLGNAATPLGIEAMKQLEREEKPGERASLNMIKLAVINACSVELIPTTVAALRARAGSASPLDILPCVIIVSVCSLAAALTAAELLEIGDKHGH